MSESKESDERAFIIVPESKDSGGVGGVGLEEVVGDAVLGAVLKEAAKMWLENEGYAQQLRDWVSEHKHEFTDYVDVKQEDWEYKLNVSPRPNQPAHHPTPNQPAKC